MLYIDDIHVLSKNIYERLDGYAYPQKINNFAVCLIEDEIEKYVKTVSSKDIKEEG